MISEKPVLRGHFHQAAFFTALGACSVLLPLSQESTIFWANIIYSVCMLAMFGISALYHRPNWASPERRKFMSRIDRCGIFLMIAGSFTPVSLTMDADSARSLLTLIWTVAVIGIFSSLMKGTLNIPKWVDSILFVAAGWLILPYLPKLSLALSNKQLTLIVLGGVLYTVGAVFYALKWPVLFPRYFGYHEVFHTSKFATPLKCSKTLSNSSILNCATSTTKLKYW